MLALFCVLVRVYWNWMIFINILEVDFFQYLCKNRFGLRVSFCVCVDLFNLITYWDCMCKKLLSYLASPYLCECCGR